jgi:protein O-GlcNAc transferase
MTIPQAFEIALRHHRAGKLKDAESIYREILAAQPNHAEALHHLGVIAHQLGRHDAAVEWIRRAIGFDPNNPVAHSNLGEACRTLGRLDDAMAAFRRALELKPDYADAHYNLGITLQQRGQLDGAIAAYRRALELEPHLPEACNNLGIALQEGGQIDEAIAAFRRALEIQPNYPNAQYNLGNALRRGNQLDEAVAAFRRALQLKPDYPEAHNNLGSALKDLGQLDEAIAAFRRALQAREQFPEAYSNLVYTLHFHPGQNRRTIAAEQQGWNRRFSHPLKHSIQRRANDGDPERQLRVGYVSPDFRDHVVGRNMIPLFERHDRRNFEILCYSGVLRPDKLTEEFRQRADQWRSTVGVPDEAMADIIRQDRVDILVDLTQHMAGNRLPVFARKPAPVQVSFAGYPENTGLETIEYRISDRRLDAGSPDENPGKEDRVYRIDSFWCYDPCGVEAEVSPLPALKSGMLTLGCLNNFCKVNEPGLRLWTEALGAVKDSRLVMRSPAGSSRRRILEALAKGGVDARRVSFVDLLPRRQYLELYHRLDIALDTFPYNGHSTSMDALWMGVPVVSLAGEMPVSRAGLSQLTNLGLPELVARSESDYVEIVTNLGTDLPRLSQLRSTLRHRMKTSILMDAPRFTRQVEQAYRKMWQAWRRTQPPNREV